MSGSTAQTTTSWSAPPARCRPSCTSSGAAHCRATTTWTMPTPAWATKWRGARGGSWRGPRAGASSSSGTGPSRWSTPRWASSVLLGRKIIVVILDNRGYGCIERLQIGSGGASFNNMLDDCVPEGGARSAIDFAMHGRSMGADAVHVRDTEELRSELRRARAASKSQVLVINTTHQRTTGDGGAWWEVAVPEVSARAEVGAAHRAYLQAKTRQRRLAGRPKPTH